MKTITKNISFTEDLAKWMDAKIGAGYADASEVVREALRFKRQAEASDYLNPRPLKPGTLARIYSTESKSEQEQERRFLRRAVKKPEAE
jgi:Arc/MetJ-type ribon-helix-helix transcriptional regulator